MDFRTVNPKSISWRKTGKTVYASPNFGSRTKILFQLPRCNCTVSLHSPGMFRLEVSLDPTTEIHKQFADWIADMECSSVGPWSIGLSKSSTIYKNGLRFMFFSDTVVFDAAGEMTAHFDGAKSCSGIFELVGLWMTDSKYGLKFKIAQLKIYDDALEYKKEPETHECEFEFVDE